MPSRKLFVMLVLVTCDMFSHGQCDADVRRISVANHSVQARSSVALLRVTDDKSRSEDYYVVYPKPLPPECNQVLRSNLFPSSAALEESLRRLKSGRKKRKNHQKRSQWQKRVKRRASLAKKSQKQKHRNRRMHFQPSERMPKTGDEVRMCRKHPQTKKKRKKKTARKRPLTLRQNIRKSQ